MTKDVVVLDYGSGNVRSVVRALEHVGARVELTGDLSRAEAADGLLVPGVGNFHACMAGLLAAGGEGVAARRAAASPMRPSPSTAKVAPRSRRISGAVA